jgi:hypothetical protein
VEPFATDGSSPQPDAGQWVDVADPQGSHIAPPQTGVGEAPHRHPVGLGWHSTTSAFTWSQ